MKSRLGRIILVSFLIVLAFMGCEPKTKHKVLNFLFDGVPPLATPTPDIPIGTHDQAVAPVAETHQPIVSTHQPFGERKCASCHDKAQGNRVDTTSTLCFRCHEDDKTTGKILHAPVAKGKCLSCHVSHQSEFESLLTRSLPALCFECHDRTLMQAGVHTVSAEQVCTVCHDSHSSMKMQLLK